MFGSDADKHSAFQFSFWLPSNQCPLKSVWVCQGYPPTPVAQHLVFTATALIWEQAKIELARRRKPFHVFGQK
jgi:hypothetical protein